VVHEGHPTVVHEGHPVR